MHSTFKDSVASVALFYEESVLLGKRLVKYKGQFIPLGGYWSIFGGLVEEGESLTQAATRELKEETEIIIDPSDLIFVKQLETPSVYYNIYACHLNSLVLPNLNFEHTEYGWFKTSDLSSFPYLIDEPLVIALKEYIS